MVTDRYRDSSVAYQGAGRPLPARGHLLPCRIGRRTPWCPTSPCSSTYRRRSGWHVADPSWTGSSPSRRSSMTGYARVPRARRAPPGTVRRHRRLVAVRGSRRADPAGPAASGAAFATGAPRIRGAAAQEDEERQQSEQEERRQAELAAERRRIEAEEARRRTDEQAAARAREEQRRLEEEAVRLDRDKDDRRRRLAETEESPRASPTARSAAGRPREAFRYLYADTYRVTPVSPLRTQEPDLAGRDPRRARGVVVRRAPPCRPHRRFRQQSRRGAHATAAADRPVTSRVVIAPRVFDELSSDRSASSLSCSVPSPRPTGSCAATLPTPGLPP